MKRQCHPIFFFRPILSDRSERDSIHLENTPNFDGFDFLNESSFIFGVTFGKMKNNQTTQTKGS